MGEPKTILHHFQVGLLTLMIDSFSVLVWRWKEQELKLNLILFSCTFYLYHVLRKSWSLQHINNMSQSKQLPETVANTEIVKALVILLSLEIFEIHGSKRMYWFQETVEIYGSKGMYWFQDSEAIFLKMNYGYTMSYHYFEDIIRLL